MCLENPILLFRYRHDLLQQQLANMADISRPQLAKVEAGEFKNLPKTLQEVTGISNETYHRFQHLKRRSLQLETERPLDQFATQAEFKDWRIEVSWNKFIQPSLRAFATALCTSMADLYEFEEAKQTFQLSPATLAALADANVKLFIPDHLVVGPFKENNGTNKDGTEGTSPSAPASLSSSISCAS